MALLRIGSRRDALVNSINESPGKLAERPPSETEEWGTRGMLSSVLRQLPCHGVVAGWVRRNTLANPIGKFLGELAQHCASKIH